MNKIGLRFMLRYSHFLNVILDEPEVDDIIRKWNSGHYKLKGEPRITGPGYGVLVDEIIGLHRFSLEEVQTQPS